MQGVLQQIRGVLGKLLQCLKHTCTPRGAQETHTSHIDLLSDQGLNIMVVFKIILIFIKKNVQFNYDL